MAGVLHCYGADEIEFLGSDGERVTVEYGVEGIKFVLVNELHGKFFFTESIDLNGFPGNIRNIVAVLPGVDPDYFQRQCIS